MAIGNAISTRIILFLILGLTVFVLYFYFFVQPSNVIKVLTHTNLLYYGSAFFAFLVSTLFNALTWRSLLNNLSLKPGFRRIFLFMWVGMFFDVTVPEPGWSGDLSKAYMLAKQSKQAPGKIVASVISQKIIIMFITVVDLFLGLTLLALNYTLPIAVLVFIAFVLFLSIFALFVVVYLSTKPKATQKLLDWLIKIVSFFLRNRWDPKEFRRNSEETLGMFHEGMSTLSKNKKALFRPVTLAFISWSFDVSAVFLVFVALGYSVPVDKVLIVYALTGTLQSVGISLVGFTEFVMSTSYQVLGIFPAVSFSATLLTRIITLWFKLVLSYVAFQYAGLKLLLDKPRKSIDIVRETASKSRKEN